MMSHAVRLSPRLCITLGINSLKEIGQMSERQVDLFPKGLASQNYKILVSDPLENELGSKVLENLRAGNHLHFVDMVIGHASMSPDEH